MRRSTLRIRTGSCGDESLAVAFDHGFFGPAAQACDCLAAVAADPNAKDVLSLETALAARTNPGAPSISNEK